mmetsp:Transcript_2249/g.4047  ORF Transcript_2249/g.4047 Transcript_2249/m.4047 type:complete len:987 (-) Transcript_2249:87-3047(-)
MENEYPPDSEQVFRHQDPIPDANKRYLMICEENARAQMTLESPTHNHSAQRVGRLYGAGMNHPLVEDGVSREVDGHSIGGSPIRNTTSSAVMAQGNLPVRKGKNTATKGGLMSNTISLEHSVTNKHENPPPVQSQHTFSAYPSHTGGGGGVDLRYVQPMKTATALGMVDTQAGGKYYVPNHVHEPYAPPITGKPQKSLFTKTTPLMWDLKKAKEIDNSACTKSVLFQQSVMSGLGDMDNKSATASHMPSAFIPSEIGGSQHYNQHAVQSSQHSMYENGYGYDDHSYSAQSFNEPKEGEKGSVELSALQQTLVDCGKLRRADDQYADRMSQEVMKSLQSDINQTKKHAMWLKHKQQNSNRGRRIGDKQLYDDSFISGLDDNAGSFFSQQEMDQQDAEYAHETPPRRSRTDGVSRQRGKNGLKTLRQQAAAHSNSSGDLSKYKKNVSMKSRGFRGNSSVMKVKGSRLEEATQSRVLPSAERRSRSERNTPNDSKLISSKDFKSGSLARDKDILTRDKAAPKAKVYSEDMAAHLDVTLVTDSNNPHRARFRGDSDVKFGSHQSMRALRKKEVDPKAYTKSSINTQYGGYNVTVKEPIIKDLPSKDYITKAMTQISKQMLISYSTRIVETGAALRALQDMKHATPGVAAILELNRAMIAAAAFNPSPWEVSRQQFQHVMHDQIPWLPEAEVARLASAYDPFKSGVIKFARMTAALMAGNRPAMSILMTNICRDPDKVDGSGNVFLLRLLHSLYEDCDGGVVEEIASTMEKDPQKCMQMAKPNSNTGLGIKLEDVPEILSVCATNLEEETEIKELAMEVVQVLYEYGKKQDEAFNDLDERYKRMQTCVVRPSTSVSSASFMSESRGGSSDSLAENTLSSTMNPTSSTLSNMLREKENETQQLDDPDRLFAGKVLKFDMLKSISHINRVSQNAFIKCVTRHPVVMKEFGRQVIQFRDLITPYQVKGSVTYEDSLNQNSSYGTVSHSTVSHSH